MSSEQEKAHSSVTAEKQPGCLFCSIHHKEIPSAFVHEDEHAFAIRDINPQAPTHILVIPRKHVDNIARAEDQSVLGSLFQSAALIAKKEKLDNGFRLVVNTGADGGQTVNHLHIHILGGRPLSWPPG